MHLGRKTTMCTLQSPGIAGCIAQLCDTLQIWSVEHCICRIHHKLACEAHIQPWNRIERTVLYSIKKQLYVTNLSRQHIGIRGSVDRLAACEKITSFGIAREWSKVASQCSLALEETIIVRNCCHWLERGSNAFPRLLANCSERRWDENRKL